MRRKNQSIEYRLLMERTHHVPKQLSLPQKCFPSFAWMSYISEMDVFISWCTIERLGKSHNTAIVVDIGGSGNENSSARGKLCWNKATLNHVLVRFVQKLRTQVSSAPGEAKRNPIRARSGFLLCGHEFTKFASVNFPAYVVRSFLNVPQDRLKVMVSFAFIACSENRTQFAWPPCQIRLRFREDVHLHQ